MCREGRRNEVEGRENLTCTGSCMFGKEIRLDIRGNRPEVLHSIVLSYVWEIETNMKTDLLPLMQALTRVM